jgi:hypothetical protein
VKYASCCKHAGGQNPCPEIDFDKGFNDIMAAALFAFVFPGFGLVVGVVASAHTSSQLRAQDKHMLKVMEPTCIQAGLQFNSSIVTIAPLG